ncbi:MAG: DNA repair protein RecN [Gammaproteobacteria bacterium]|nr:DNA repair protein RecN [Gammaproteobacteria bacterium]
MLQQLIVHNYALVDFLHLDFSHKMTAISGETGAGKSILLGALGLTLGDRAESGCVRQGADRADIHAVFDLSQLPQIKDYLFAKHLAATEDPDTCILRRIINQDGRSRGYINGKPVNITALKQLGCQLINIHGQHEHQHLLGRDSHITLLDAFGNYPKSLQTVAAISHDWLELERQIKALTGGQQLSDAEQQLLQYQADELAQLNLLDGELLALEQEHKQRANADHLLQAVRCALPDNPLGEDPMACLQRWQQQLQNFSQHSPHLTAAVDMLASAAIQIEESQIELQSFLQGFDEDPARLQVLEHRLDQIYSMARKHKIQAADLPEHLTLLQQQLQQNQDQEGQLEAIYEQQKGLTEAYEAAALSLTKTRKKAAKQLEKSVGEQLALLGMPDCRLELSIQSKPDTRLQPLGRDEVEILICTNPGQNAQPLAKIASGGELSRISLAIQVVIATTSITPSLIFDEVDVGIGGATAEIVGQLLSQLGQHCQLLCITHLPQVASQAQHHLQVSKSSRGQSTQTQVAALNEEQRVQEIARMLGGVKLTQQTLAHAKEMLGAGTMLH